MAEYGLGPIGPEAGINSIEIMILNKTDPNNNPFVLDVGVIDLDFNILWSERMIESAYHHDDDTDGNYEVQVNFSRTVLSDENSVIKIYMWNYASHGWEEIDASSLGNDDWDYYSCLDDYWCDEWDGVSQLMFELDTDEETHTAYYDPDTGVYYDFVAPDPPIESVYIDYMGDVVIIGVYGDFTTDSPPQYTLQFANGLISIYEDDNVMTWNYIEDGYAELYISTDILLGDTWFDVEFSVWTQDQTSDYATYELYSFYKPMMYDCDNGNEIPMDYVDDGYDDCGDGSDEDNSQFGTIADGLTFAAPISDFEIRFLNCNEVDSLDDCSLVASGTLESGIASAPAEVGCTMGCDIPFTFEDVDMDGMISSGDTLSVDDSMGFYVAIYDTWAGQYTDDSTAGPVSLPGFGGFLAMICLIGAGLISRRD